MYSYEDGSRAVQLYIKFGKRTGPTIRTNSGEPELGRVGPAAWAEALDQTLKLSSARKTPRLPSVIPNTTRK